MASGGEEARRPSETTTTITTTTTTTTTSSVGLESLFPPGGGAGGGGCCETEDEDGPELAGLREALRGWLAPYEPLIVGLQRLLVWERPLYSVIVALTLNTLFW